MFGQANISTNKFDVTFSRTEDLWPVHSRLKLDVCTPFMDVVYDNEGMIDFDNLENNADYDFKGVEVNPETEDFLQYLVDSLEQVFRFHATENPYSTSLPAKIYAGVSVYPHPKISFGALSRTEILAGEIGQQFTLSANFYPLRMLSAAFSYSLIDGYYKNLGLGLSFKPGPFNLYIITDTGPSIAFWPYEARLVNLRLGLNLVFGCNKMAKKHQKFDLPLIY